MGLKLNIIRAICSVQALIKSPGRLLSCFQIQDADVILEVGCAIGHYTMPLLELVPKGKIYAVDVWKEGLDFLRNRTKEKPNLVIINCGAESLILPEESLDKIILLNTLHEITDFANALSKMIKFLKPGGKLFYQDPVINTEIIAKECRGILRDIGNVVDNIRVFERI